MQQSLWAPKRESISYYTKISLVGIMFPSGVDRFVNLDFIIGLVFRFYEAAGLIVYRLPSYPGESTKNRDSAPHISTSLYLGLDRRYYTEPVMGLCQSQI